MQNQGCGLYNLPQGIRGLIFNVKNSLSEGAHTNLY